jgi:hypothetical protein
MPLRIQVIVEGQGEVNAVPSLLARVWQDLGGDYLELLPPFRQPQGTLRKEEGLRRAVNAAWARVCYRASPTTRQLLLLLMDSEGVCPAERAPELLGWARQARADADVICILAHHMFETWFAACASSLAGHNGLPADLSTPEDPEGRGLGLGLGWLKKQLRRKYQEPIDQPKFVSMMDIAMRRANSPSFAKLCKELAARLPGSPASRASGESPQPPGGPA